MTGTRWERIKDTFNAALAVPMAERGALIERLCAGDAELRREVESLLSARTLSIVRTAGAAAAVAAMSTTGPSDPYAQSRVGTMIGRYKLLQIIGEGGFGTVYMAEQTEPVRRRVALKIIKPGMDSKAIIARFEAERQALALMDHPHIARVLDGGVTPLAGVGAAAADGGTGERGPATGERGHAPGGGGGLPYFVMEYVIGDPITTFADAHALSIADRLTVFRQVCSAVQHAHTKGIIHRDLKPGNVLVSMVDDKPFAKVIDFGIAKATGGAGLAGGGLTDRTLFTEHRMLLGTPEYMSPEQAEGSPDIDTRTDVYALGVLLYELLTGSTPIDSERLRRAAFDEMRRIIREEEPPSPSIRLSRSLDRLAATAASRGAEPARLGALVRGELDWIVMRALEKERARRYETASALGDDVARHLAGEPVIAAPVSRAYRIRKFVRRNKVAVLALSSIAAVVMAAGTTVIIFADMAVRASRREAQQAEAAKASAAEAERRAEMLLDAAAFAEVATLSRDRDQLDFRSKSCVRARRHLSRSMEDLRGSSLYLRGSFTGLDVEAIVAGPTVPQQLQSIFFMNSSAADDALKSLSHASSLLDDVEHIAMTNAPVSADGIAAMTAVDSSLRTLRSLEFVRGSIAVDGLSALASPSSKLENLRILYLGDTCATDEGLRAVTAQGTGLRALDTLVLANTQVGPEGIRLLAAPSNGLE
ncbi:MAG: protein kinase domain-containing protein, partial [Phycisphaerales bacterium]